MTQQIKFLKMVVNGHPLVQDGTEFSLLAEQRVYQDRTDQLTNLLGRFWVNNLTTIVGRNATGKTVLMRLVLGILSLLLNNDSINQTRLNECLIGNSKIQFQVYFYGSDQFVYLDDIILSPTHNKQHAWTISSEKIVEKKITRHTPKKDIFNFETASTIIDRTELSPEISAVLADDDSLFRIIRTKKQYMSQTIIDTLSLTNFNNLLYDQPNVPPEILAYLDSTIEYLKIDYPETGNTVYRLKFKNSSQEISANNFTTIEQYLSSGTAKGVTLYQDVLHALQTGGIIFVDKLENHFNHAIVRSFIEYFTDPQINTNHATLIFSTHYSELLDDLERGDQIYIALRQEKMSFTRFSDTPMREDISRTEVFDADNLQGTSPDYQSYLALRKATKRVIKHE